MARTVTIFGSSRPVEKDDEYILAFNVGKNLALSGFTICNGGYSGIMEASARGAKEAGGMTIGVTFENKFKKKANKWIDKELFQPTLVDRLLKLVDLGDAYVVLKGGTGTLLELAAVWEFVNKGMLMKKPIVIVGDFWDGLVETLRKELLWEGEGDCSKIIHMSDSPEECAGFLKKVLDT